MKLTQLIKLFNMFKESLMQSLNIFRIREGICFTFQFSEEFEIYLEKIKWLGAHMSVAQFCLSDHPSASPACAHHFTGHHR
jgi:hypothetical protein